MFERYTEKARRVVFFARYEASEFGAPFIETEHILWGLLKEDEALAYRFLPSLKSTDSIRRQVRAVTPARPKISTSVDLPLSHESQRVLAYAAEEADKLNHRHVGTEHLLLGLLRIAAISGVPPEPTRYSRSRLGHLRKAGSLSCDKGIPVYRDPLAPRDPVGFAPPH